MFENIFGIVCLIVTILLFILSFKAYPIKRNENVQLKVRILVIRALSCAKYNIEFYQDGQWHYFDTYSTSIMAIESANKLKKLNHLITELPIENMEDEENDKNKNK